MVNKREVIRIKGFTLVEIMIVVAIIALLAAIAIPNLLRARVTANESATQAALRTISTAYETYAASHGGDYNVALADLSDTTKNNPPYLNTDYSTGTHNGYNFACTTTATSYTCTAKPTSCTTTGTKSFTMTSSVLATDETCTAAGG